MQLRTITYPLLLAGILGLLSFCSQQKKTTVYLAGDSTMCLYTPDRAPVTGWGMPFAYFFDESVRIKNHARGGRSTRTFISEGRWAAIADSLTEGDYVLIQFGHNDEAKEEKYKDRYTPVADYKTNLTRFIKEARSRKAIPVLITPVSRMRFNKEGRAEETHKEYTDAMYAVAAATGTALIDLDASSRKLYDAMGPKDAPLLFMHLQPGEHPAYPGGQKDNTHFNEYGARLIAQLVLQGLREKNIELANHIVQPKKK